MDIDFRLKKIIWNENNSIVFLGEDETCIKKVDLPKCFSRLENEARCLEILKGNIAPKLVSYNGQEHELRTEYINGLTIIQYAEKYKFIPKWFFAKVVLTLYELLDYEIEYGGDRKIEEHFIIEDGTNNLRVIDFGLSNIIKERQDIIELWKHNYRREFAFVFNESKHDEQSKEYFRNELLMMGIRSDIINDYFDDYLTVDNILNE